jgi:hypothetical protein
MFKKLHRSLTIVELRKIDEEELPMQISALEKYFLFIPSEYINFVKTYNATVIFEYDKVEMLRIWLPFNCLGTAQNFEVWIQKYIPNAFPFADNASSEFLAYFDEQEMKGIYKFPYGSIRKENATFIANNLHELLVEGKGLEFVALSDN